MSSFSPILLARRHRLEVKHDNPTQAMAHPLLFGLIALVGIAALGLSAYWTHVVQHDPSDRFRSLIIFALFNSAWTVLFASAFVMWLLTGKL